MNRKTCRPALLALSLTVAALALSGSARAGFVPNNLALVVNADSWASKTIANEYMQLRGVPPINVVHLTGLKEFQTMDVEAFRQQILLPVFKTLYDRGVLNHIDCITYSADIPTAIEVKADFGDTKPAKYQTTVGSINGLTYLYQLVLAKRMEYCQLSVNFYMRRPTQSLSSVPTDPSDVDAFQKSTDLMTAKKYDEALKVLQPLSKKLLSNVTVHYNLACCQARLGRSDEAIDALIASVKAGWMDRKHAESDPDLESLRSSPNFKALLTKMDANKSKPFDVQPTTGFRSQYQVEPARQQGGKRGDPLHAVHRAWRDERPWQFGQRGCAGIAAKCSCRWYAPSGTIYFTENSDVRAKTRRPGFQSAVNALAETPVKGAIIDGKMPQGKSDVAGTMMGIANFDWSQSGSTMLPGAICEHLTSFGGAMLETNGQTPISEFIRYGAAGTSGTVTEPYAIQAKFPFPFIHAHYARGCTLAEAFYQSVFGPYQLLILGDPLCQPWAKLLKIEIDDLKPNQKVSGRIVIKPRIAGGPTAESALDRYEMYINGRQGKFDSKVRTITIETDQLGDGWQELSIVAVSKGPLETRSRTVVPVIVDNGHGTVELEMVGNSAGKLTFGDKLVVKASTPVAATIQVACSGHIMGQIAGPEGKLEIDSRKLGMGPVLVQAISRLEGKPVFSAPVQVQIDPPKKIERLSKDPLELKGGLKLTVGNKKLAVVESTRKSDWLAEKKPKSGEPLVLDGYFVAAADDLYQFQFRGNAAGEILINGKTIRASNFKAGTNGWTMVPVHLAKGYFRFQLKGIVANSPSLDIRFGNRGCRTLSSVEFKHRD